MKHSVPNKIVLIGASTGGPEQIQKIITALPNLNDTTVIIAQHMVQDFIPSFMKCLQDGSFNKLFVAQDNQAVESECIYLCNGQTAIKKKRITICALRIKFLLSTVTTQI